MNLEQMKYYKEKLGYTDEMLSVFTDVPEETIQKIFAGDWQFVDVEDLSEVELILRPVTAAELQEIERRRNPEFAIKLKEIEDILQQRREKNPPSCVREAAVQYGVKKGDGTLDDYYALPEDCRTELINGDFFVMEAPATLHQSAVLEIGFQIKSYIKHKNGKCAVFVSPVDVQLDCDDKTMVQPDVLIICKPDKITRSHIVGAPDFIVEILSPSTRKRDLTLKCHKYRMAGVREYWIVDAEKERIITYFFAESDAPTIWGIKDVIPVRIYDGDLKLDMSEIDGLGGNFYD